MNPLAELKNKFAPQSRWGAIGIAPRRESSRLTWSEPEDRRQPQDGALVNEEALLDAPQVSPLRRGPVAATAPELIAAKPVVALVS